MNEKEIAFAKSIKDKIDKYKIATTFKMAVSKGMNKFVKSEYKDGSENEIIDIGIESWLCKKSAYYFISKYTEFVLPGIGEMSASNLYYFQKEILKDFDKYKKIVVTKTRQCLTENNSLLTKNGIKSIKDIQIGERVETLRNGKRSWTFVLDWINQGKKEVIRIKTENGTIECTEDHKIYSYGWIEAGKLKKGNLILNSEDNYIKIKSITKIGKHTVYDITTESHDFLANGMLVHNCGMSTLSSLIFFWKLVNFSNQWLVIISKDGKSATDVLGKIKFNLKNIPYWMGLKEKFNNVKSLGLNNNSHIDSFARSRSAGRGTSPTLALLDEAAFYETASNIEGIVSSVVPSLTRTGGQLFVVSTPNGSAEGSEGYWYYKQVKALEKEPNTRTNMDVLYDIDWWEVPDFEGIRPYKGYNDKLNEYIKLDYFNNQNIKEEARKYFTPIVNDWKRNEWLKYQHDTSGEVKFKQEILKDFIVVGNTVFTSEIIKKAETKIILPTSIDKLGNRGYKDLWTWKEPIEGKKYILAIDVAKGSSNDSSCVQVLETHTGEQVCEYLGQCTTKDLAKIANEIGKYYNNAYIVCECNSIGEAVFTELYYNLNYSNLYRQKKTGKNGVSVWTGWMTTTKTRDLITDKFIDYYYEDSYWNEYRPHSERLISQMKHWVWLGGRPDHTTGEHDDAIMAMAIALFNKSEAARHRSGEDEVVFVGESGLGISRSEDKKEKYYDKVDVTNRKDYIETENKVYKNAGIPDGFDNANEIYNWLIS